MAEFTRPELRKIFEAAEIEVPKDVLTKLCELHSDSSEGMGDTIRDLKKDLKKAQDERDDALAKVPKDGVEMVPKADLDNLQGEFDTYKQGVEEKETTAKKQAAVRDLLKAAGVSEKHLDAVLRVYDLGGVELDKDGKVKDADQRTEAAKTDWADFITSTREQGANVHNPLNHAGGNGGEPESLAAALHQKYDK